MICKRSTPFSGYAFTLQPGLCFFHAFGFNAERDVLRPNQTVVALGKLLFQHMRIFHAYIIELVMLRLNLNDLVVSPPLKSSVMVLISRLVSSFPVRCSMNWSRRFNSSPNDLLGFPCNAYSLF